MRHDFLSLWLFIAESILWPCARSAQNFTYSHITHRTEIIYAIVENKLNAEIPVCCKEEDVFGKKKM